MPAPRPFIATSLYCIAFWNNVVICDVRGEIPPSAVREISDAYLKLHESYPAGVVGITIVRAEVKMSSMGAHAEAGRCMREVRTKLLQAAILLESQGVVAQLMRSFVRTVNSLARMSELRLVGDVEEAVRVTVPHVVTQGSSSLAQLERELLAVVLSVRSAPPA